ncbi:hypothetical protein ATO11_07150 [Pseudaestuariivita atlantica]|uniref:CobE/GbiG C-terminal domain-containing protein n=2 Tax=Pseudaestuariivita atlantica TaxID=1317121 RepID=A0A0L1JRP9_9RHOB|nr:hypothetical protein ATO11_07150 [Pseudaestuariivita atlantica]
MIVAGFGMRAQAPWTSFAELADGVAATHLAVLAEKAALPGFVEFAARTGLPVVEVGAVAGIDTPTRAARIEERFGTGSVCEAVALAASGGGRLIAARRVSQDGMVTMAVAEGKAGT